MPATIGRGVDLIRRRPSISTVPIVGPSDPLLIQGGGCPREPDAGSDIGGQAGARSDELDLPGAAGTGRARRVIDD